MKMKLNDILNFVGQVFLKTGTLVFFSFLFHKAINGYFFIDGKWRDFSIFGWLLILVICGYALWRYKNKDNQPMMFALQLVVLGFVFDFYLMIATGSARIYIPVVNCLFAFEGALILFSLLYKIKNLLEWSVATVLIIYFASVILFSFAPWNVLLISFLVFLWYIRDFIWQKMYSRNMLMKNIVRVFSVLLVLVYGGYGFKLWYDVPGIKFYEKPVEEAKNIKVSVVVPVYNAEKVVKRCLDSLRRQTLKDIEFILVNDGSTDNSADILAQYAKHDKRFRVITQENKYIGEARNTGIRAARGEYIGFIDNDDEISEDYYEDMYNTAKKHNVPIAVAINRYVIKYMPYRQTSKMFYSKFLKDKEFVNSKDVQTLFVWDKLYSREFLNQHNIKSTSLRIIYEDFYFILQALVYSPKIAIAHKAMHYWLRHPVTTSKTFYDLPLSPEIAKYIDEVYDFIENATISDEERKIWIDFINIRMRWYLTNVYKFLRDEDKPLLQQIIDEKLTQYGGAFNLEEIYLQSEQEKYSHYSPEQLKDVKLENEFLKKYRTKHKKKR